MELLKDVGKVSTSCQEVDLMEGFPHMPPCALGTLERPPHRPRGTLGVAVQTPRATCVSASRGNQESLSNKGTQTGFRISPSSDRTRLCSFSRPLTGVGAGVGAGVRNLLVGAGQRLSRARSIVKCPATGVTRKPELCPVHHRAWLRVGLPAAWPGVSGGREKSQRRNSSAY